MDKVTASDWHPSKRVERGNAAEQIFDDLREGILGGKLPRGTKLPTEKRLADSYGVSSATIREAVRGLTVARLIEVRHGSGAYVTANTDQLIAFSLRSVIQLERIGAPHVLGVLFALISYAAEFAATQATESDISAIQASLKRIQQGTEVEVISSGVSGFIEAIANASRNPLLVALSRLLAKIQIGLVAELADGSVESWHATAGAMQRHRLRILEAIKKRNPEAARKAARSYQERAIEIFTAQPNASGATIPNPILALLISSAQERRDE
ncbi:FadR/GntR family transcriptional regulator [Cupriavidus sp. TMH.W2]|uniref:FadR/GntR family transcriptional regulator n=1 Tax=Cupriavidus sp. TMH.W2 TaxID=3434465 RepID=UPI003D77902A